MHGGYHVDNVDIDLSVSLNPFSSPEADAALKEAQKEAAGSYSRYPDIDQKEVRSALAASLGTDTERVIAGNGSSELIMAAVRACRPSSALLIEPCFGGYEYALRSFGICRICRYLLKEEDGFLLTDDVCSHLTEDIDMIFLCDPWNPTGRNINKDTLEKILKLTSDLGIRVILDRSFYMISDGYLNDHKITGSGPEDLIDRYDNLFIIGSYTKCFSLPGIRMGYAISRPENVKMLKDQVPEWNLGSLESACIRRLSRLAQDGMFFDGSIDLIKKERGYLNENLSSIGCKVYKSDTNFILFRCHESDGKSTYEKMIEQGILIRKCDDFYGLGNGFYRIAVRSRDDNEKLIRALSNALKV